VIEPDGSSLVATAGPVRAGSAGHLDADSPPWAAPLLGFELTVSTAPAATPVYRPLPVTPASGRDLTLLVSDALPVARVAAELAGAGEPLLESVAVTGEYRSGDLPGGARSVTFHLTFRAIDRTLETAEVDRAEARLLAVLGRELGVHRRDQGAPAPE
jgi:phenylalanyl-tRNA synthetase beta chain